jgi:hypothetical protein
MNIDNKKRLFYVVDSTEYNEELYTTYEEACKIHNELVNKTPETKPRMYIAEVKNAYFDEQIGLWNYTDHSDTFEIIKKLA